MWSSRLCLGDLVVLMSILSARRDGHLLVSNACRLCCIGSLSSLSLSLSLVDFIGEGLVYGLVLANS